MKKKNLLWSMLAIFMAAMMCGVITACGDDDNRSTASGNSEGTNSGNGTSGNGTSSSIVGTWTGSDGVVSYTYTFNANGTGIQYFINSRYGMNETSPFTYTASNNNEGTIVFKIYDEYSGNFTYVESYKISGTTMIIYDDEGEEYFRLTKQGATGGDDGSYGGNSGNGNSSISGTWSGTDDDETYTLTFKSDGTGTWTTVYYDPYSGTERDSGTFTYRQESSTTGTITIRIYDSYSGYVTDVYYYSISGNKMYIKESPYSSYDIVLTKQ